MALFSSELPSFVTIITELSKHDLGELVGEERGKAEEEEEEKLRG